VLLALGAQLRRMPLLDGAHLLLRRLLLRIERRACALALCVALLSGAQLGGELGVLAFRREGIRRMRLLGFTKHGHLDAQHALRLTRLGEQMRRLRRLCHRCLEL
jgi:hypothetical protein